MMIERVLRQIEQATTGVAVGAQIHLDGVCKVFDLGKARVAALKHIDMEVRDNEFLAITGPSGSGKTTLLNLIGCLDQPSAGQVVIDGENVGVMTANELAGLRARKLGLVFQSFNLIPVLTAAENIEFPLLMTRPDLSAQERRRRAREIISQLGLDALAGRRPNELSGGECQRVAVARALVGDPMIVLADEPTSNLDSKTGDALLRMMRRLHEDRRITFIFSTHDARLVSLASRVIELHDGEIVDDCLR